VKLWAPYIYFKNMSIEHEPQKEPVEKNCFYCDEVNKADWQIRKKDGELVLLCSHHLESLNKANEARKQEQLLFDAQWRIENEYDEKFDEEMLKDTDDWENPDNWLN
jgi:hypothetical protein